MSWLATTASVTPFIGFFGTVLGIVEAFTELETEGSTTIRAVAPGIAVALVTTAAGLFAAIPALVAQLLFAPTQRIRICNGYFSLEFLNLMERTFS